MNSEPLCPSCGKEMFVPVYRDYFNKTWIACCRCNECDTKWKTGEFIGKTKDEAAEKARIAACRRTPQKPLTLDELRNMHGMPVWIEDVEKWAIIDVRTDTEKGRIYAHGLLKESTAFCVNMDFSVENGMKCWRQKPDDLSRTIGRIINE